MKFLASLTLLCFLAIPGSAKPCAAPVAVALWSQDLADMIPAEIDWFGAKMQKKYPCIVLQASPTESTKYSLAFVVSGENHSGAEIKHSTVNAPITDQNGMPAGNVSIPTSESVPYNSTVRTYKMGIVDLKADKQPILHVFFRTQYRQYGGQNILTIIASNKERHPLDGLLKDALKFIAEREKSHTP